MSKRCDVSIVIFGATGFTGRHAVLEMAKLSKKYPNLTWGVAGRSQSKLESLMRDISKETFEDQSHVRVLVADVSDEPSLQAMCSQCRVVVNCCGPYRLYGEPVVRAALHCNTHVVDVTGEPQFMETMQLKYDAMARELGVYIVSACGYDCVPNDMGTVYLQHKFGGVLNTVESYMSSELLPGNWLEAWRYGVVHTGTWESLVYGLAHHNELKALRQKLYPESMPKLTPRLPKRGLIHRHDGGYCVPFPGADNSVVYRSQRRLADGGTRPAQFRAYVKFSSFLGALFAVVAAAFLYVMAQFPWPRRMLLSFPRACSLGLVGPGPTTKVMSQTRFRLELRGEGWTGDTSGPHDRAVTAYVWGMNPGYGATVSALLYSAITILTESHNMPDKGVLTPAVAFRNTDYIKNLHENGMKFEITETASI